MTDFLLVLFFLRKKRTTFLPSDSVSSSVSVDIARYRPIMSLMEIAQESQAVKEAVYTFLDDLLDDMEFIKLAIAYKKRKDGFYSENIHYFISDEKGEYIDSLEGDPAMVFLQNSFNRIVNCASTGKKSAFGRSEQRKYWNSLTDKEREDISAQAELDLKRGK